MKTFHQLCSWLSRLTLAAASAALAALGIVVLYGVVMRYGFNAAPPFVEQVALLLVICVAMFGACVGVREVGHIGLDSLVKLLPRWGQRLCEKLSDVLVLLFAVVLLLGGLQMVDVTRGNDIPTLGISEAWRYAPPMLAGLLISLFSIERLIGADPKPSTD